MPRRYLVKRLKPPGYFSTGCIFRPSLEPSKRRPPRGLEPARVHLFRRRRDALKVIEAMGFLYHDADKRFAVVPADAMNGKVIRLLEA